MLLDSFSTLSIWAFLLGASGSSSKHFCTSQPSILNVAGSLITDNQTPGNKAPSNIHSIMASETRIVAESVFIFNVLIDMCNDVREACTPQARAMLVSNI